MVTKWSHKARRPGPQRPAPSSHTASDSGRSDYHSPAEHSLPIWGTEGRRFKSSQPDQTHCRAWSERYSVSARLFLILSVRQRHLEDRCDHRQPAARRTWRGRGVPRADATAPRAARPHIASWVRDRGIGAHGCWRWCVFGRCGRRSGFVRAGRRRRLPTIKELQGIVDYSKSPDTSGSAAIDSLFETSTITNEAGEKDYPAFWASATLVAYPDNAGDAAYVSFGRALGYMNGQWMDVHGAGAARSDPKTGDAGEFPTGHGPQGDAIRIDNYVRCVQGGATLVEETQA